MEVQTRIVWTLSVNQIKCVYSVPRKEALPGYLVPIRQASQLLTDSTHFGTRRHTLQLLPKDLVLHLMLATYLTYPGTYQALLGNLIFVRIPCLMWSGHAIRISKVGS